MLVVDSSARNETTEQRHATAIFGVGLVGQAIASYLKVRLSASQIHLPFDWAQNASSSAQLDTIERCLLEKVKKPGVKTKRISIVWSAGAAGFSAPQDVLDNEFASFERVVSLCENLHMRDPDLALDFHLLSSAGGIFEGQRHVDGATIPRPLRPYAVCKLRQEDRIEQLGEGINAYVYRPSTIYGYHNGGRPGLIITLIRNGYQHRTTRIFGSPDTMRDFVHVSDISRYIGNHIISNGGEGGTFLLARGKPTNMRSVISLVEEVIGKRLYLQYDPKPSNAQHNTYRPFAARHMTNSISLRYGIKLSASQWFQNEFGQTGA